MCSAPFFYVKKVVSSKNLLPLLFLYMYMAIPHNQFDRR